MEIKKEWLIDRAEAILKQLNEEIERTEREAAVIKEHARAEEKENEEYLKQLETEWHSQGHSDRDIYNELAELSDSQSQRMHEDYYSRIDNAELRLTALKQDREIYKYYLENNK